MAILNANYANLNHEEIAKSMGLKPKYIPILVDSFKQEVASAIVELENAIITYEYADISSKAHSIKGVAGNLRFIEIYEMTKDMELAAKSNDSAFDYTAHLKAVKAAMATISE